MPHLKAYSRSVPGLVRIWCSGLVNLSLQSLPLPPHGHPVLLCVLPSKDSRSRVRDQGSGHSAPAWLILTHYTLSNTILVSHSEALGSGLIPNLVGNAT